MNVNTSTGSPFSVMGHCLGANLHEVIRVPTTAHPPFFCRRPRKVTLHVWSLWLPALSPLPQGSTLGLLTRSAMGAWSLSPVRVVLRRETTLPVPRVALGDENGRRRGSSRKGSSPRRSKTKRSKEKEEPEEEKEKADQCHRQVRAWTPTRYFSWDCFLPCVGYVLKFSVIPVALPIPMRLRHSRDHHLCSPIPCLGIFCRLSLSCQISVCSCLTRCGRIFRVR